MWTGATELGASKRIIVSGRAVLHVVYEPAAAGSTGTGDLVQVAVSSPGRVKDYPYKRLTRMMPVPEQSSSPAQNGPA